MVKGSPSGGTSVVTMGSSCVTFGTVGTLGSEGTFGTVFGTQELLSPGVCSLVSGVCWA